MCSRIRSWTLHENQIFSYRSVGLAGTLRPPNVSLYFVTRCEPGTQQHAHLECALLYESDRALRKLRLPHPAIWRERGECLTV